MKVVKVVAIILGALIGLVGLLALFMWLFQGRFIYTNRWLDDELDEELQASDFQQYTKVQIPIEKDNEDGSKVDGVWIPYGSNLKHGEKHEVPPVTFILFHGFSDKISIMVKKAATLTRCVPCNLLLMDYRGYGNSYRSPSEKAIYEDAQIALDWVFKQPNVHSDLIMLYGESDGASVALQLASARKSMILGVIVENPFLESKYEVYQRLCRPFRYIMWWVQTDRFDNRKHIGSLTNAHGHSKIPHLLSLVSDSDPIIPKNHSEALLQKFGEDIENYNKGVQEMNAGALQNGSKSKNVLVAQEIVEGENQHRIAESKIHVKCSIFLSKLLPGNYFNNETAASQSQSPKPKQRK